MCNQFASDLVTINMKLIILACVFVVATAQSDNNSFQDFTNDGNNDFNSFEDTNPRNSAFFPPSVPRGRNRFRGNPNLAFQESHDDFLSPNSFRGRNTFNDDTDFNSFETGRGFANGGNGFNDVTGFDDDRFDDDFRFSGNIFNDNRFDDDLRLNGKTRFDDDLRFNGNTRFDDTRFDDDDFDFFEAGANLRGRSLSRGRGNFDDDDRFDDDFNDDDDIFAGARFTTRGNRFRGNNDFNIFDANEVLDAGLSQSRGNVRKHPDVNALLSTFNVDEPVVSGRKNRIRNRNRNSVRTNNLRPFPSSSPSRRRPRPRGNRNFQSFENSGQLSNPAFDSASHEEFGGGISQEEFVGGVSREEFRDEISHEESGKGYGQGGSRGGVILHSEIGGNSPGSQGTESPIPDPPSQLAETSDQKKPGGKLILFHIEPVYRGLVLTMES